MRINIWLLLVSAFGQAGYAAELNEVELKPLSLEFLEFLGDFAEDELLLDAWLDEGRDQHVQPVNHEESGNE